MSTIDGTSLGNVQNESQTKDSGLFQMPYPRKDSDAKVLMDIMGTSRNINITGKFTGTPTELKAFIAAMEGIQDGTQTGSTFVGDLVTTSKTVLIESFNWSYDKANLNSIDYSLTLIEGRVL